MNRKVLNTEKSLEKIFPTGINNDHGIWQFLLDSIPTAAFMVDSKLTIILWNKMAEELTGFRAEEVLGKHCCEGERCNNCPNECELFKTDFIENQETVFYTKNGNVLHIIKNGMVFRDEKGAIIGGIEFFRDITKELETREAFTLEKAEAEAQRRLVESIINSISEGAIAVDENLQVLSFSSQAAELTGISVEDAIGKSCKDLIPNPLCAEQCPIRIMREKRTRIHGNLTRITGAGGESIPVLESSIPLLIGGKYRGSLLLLKDMKLEEKLSQELMKKNKLGELIGRSRSMHDIFYLIERLGDVDAPVIITGEQGTGRAFVAHTIHNMSIRKDGPYRVIECGTLPPLLLESEFFGHLKECVPGAVRDKIGQLELVHKGTLYLINIDAVPISLQEKLLVFLETGTFKKIGGSETIQADVRIIAATSQNLELMINEGKFLKNLFDVLKGIQIEIPPLRNRRQDIELLVAHFLKTSQNSSVVSRQSKSISAPAMRALIRYDWPGNILELQDALEFALSVCSGNTINLNDLPPEIMRSLLPQEESTEEDEVTRILRALEETHWRRTEAAQILGMDRSTLWRKMKTYGLA
ncbi:MAG: hypothetical protein A2161_21790 [Candidatus Schekmanbacteria bacterium RBG_13_48_7]|uniref:Sigma-54-dependent Fis family transcriptional regulator n=1 Tax=Candidatus Schekmanbacteria bacterium RBG_13_48_7 TaxID=1817878 RepID=A0A1F7RYP4_9BACT|nr:MAG: hypothetical protein A2161_21790 [Candidatus Schekmanbacteria bacterium RBG_13_48_7]